MLEPLATVFVAPLNHLLAQAPWARERLVPFIGKTVRFNVFPFDCQVIFTADGRVQPVPADRVADTTITFTFPVALRFLAGNPMAQQEVRVGGDTALAQEIAYLARHLRWDFEEDLSKVLGDVAAHRVGQMVKQLNAWSSNAGGNIAENLRDYWVREQPLITARRAIERFNQDVDRLRDDVERLEKRLDKLACD